MIIAREEAGEYGEDPAVRFQVKNPSEVNEEKRQWRAHVKLGASGAMDAAVKLTRRALAR